MPVGPQVLREEFRANQDNGHVGTRLVSETNRVRVWLLTILPGERFPFHAHVLDYFWTATTDGVGRSRYAGGEVRDRVYTEGDTGHLTFADGERMVHDLENVGHAPLSFVTVEFKDAKKDALPIKPK